jgi:hypothetical protein
MHYLKSVTNSVISASQCPVASENLVINSLGEHDLIKGINLFIIARGGGIYFVV